MSGLIAGSAERPLPTPFEWDAGFWEAASENRLVVQRCASCKLVRSFPRLMCPACQSLEHEWVEASGRGTLYSWSTLYRSFHPAFTELPRTLAVVALDDFPEVHLVSGLILELGQDESALRIGMPVKVVFTPLSDEMTLPEFQPLFVS